MSTKNPPKCHYGAERGWLTPEHLRDCDDRECRGCKPCPDDHCAMGGRCPNHVRHAAGLVTCPGCISKARRTIRRIVEHYTLGMRLEAIAAGVDSEAFNLIGPAASPEQLDGRDQVRGWCDYPPSADPHHPYAVLGRWDLALREDYGPQTDLFITVTSAADYLDSLLDRGFPHEREFEEFVRDLNRCLHHLDDVAHDSREPEKGAPCKSCREAGDTDPPKLRKRYAEGDDPGKDTWHCPSDPAHWWDDESYRKWVDSNYVQHATELTASQMHAQYGIKPGSLRGWASLGKVRKRGKSADGLTQYDVADALAMAGESECA